MQLQNQNTMLIKVQNFYSISRSTILFHHPMHNMQFLGVPVMAHPCVVPLMGNHPNIPGAYHSHRLELK